MPDSMIKTDGRYRELLVYGSGLIFVLANALLMYREVYYLLLLPFMLAVFYLAFFSLDKLFMTVVFLTPLSLELSRLTGGNLPVDISLPTEPLIIVIMLMIFFRLLYYNRINPEVLYHPVSLAIIFYLFWLLITSITSTMPVVSFKFLLVRSWFITVFYFLAITIFSRRKNINTFLWCYILAMLVVIVYTLYNHAGYGLVAQRAAHWVVRPFYNDHTDYGAALALFIPVLAVLSSRTISPRPLSLLARFLLVVFLFALVFSYSRAAWLSVFVAVGVWVLVRLRIRLATLVSFGLVGAVLIVMLWGDILRELEKNTQDSSADFQEHVTSMTNITSDASNLERINRWKAAIAMFRERPLFGWGPGTYMFQYAPFQNSYDRTIISTNLADGGDAHSEYLGPLSETGLVGMLSIVVVALLSLITGFRLLKKLKKRKDRLLVLGILLGLITYLVHGTLNNFLHSDKAAVPFWGFIAILVAMDLYGKKPDAQEVADR